MQVDAGTVWRPVALSTDPADPGATELTFLGVDATSGTAFAGNATTFFRLQGDTVTQQPLLAPLRHPHPAPNGGLWGLSLDGLTRIGRANPVTFEPRIATLSQVHCARCHAPSRQAAHIPLLTVADWRARIDAALDATTPAGTSPARMPADTMSTLTDAERALLRQWKEDGLQ
jgi:mono/diheme cytochrome c family protein